MFVCSYLDYVNGNEVSLALFNDTELYAHVVLYNGSIYSFIDPMRENWVVKLASLIYRISYYQKRKIIQTPVLYQKTTSKNITPGGSQPSEIIENKVQERVKVHKRKKQ